jgi:threonine aldolase
MREAMARAEVADDVLEHDPTMAALEERVADLTGQQAALWLPTGCMSNLVALMCQVGRGDRILAPRHAHIYSHELGTAAWLAGAAWWELGWTLGPGVPDPAEVRQEAIAASTYYELHTTLLALENTHNHAGGTIIPAAVYDELLAAAQANGLKVHLDGARIWHAAAAQGLTVAQTIGAVDSVSVCLSKGLAAPMGSLLAGSAQLIEQARRVRKMLGGGVRQGGVVAAAGLVALDEVLPDIDQDRQRALRLGAGLAELGLAVRPVQTNMCFVDVMDDAGVPSPVQAAALARRWTAAGVACFAMGESVRLVTHREIDDAAVDRALVLIAAA